MRMQISALKLAFGTSVLFHGLAFSVVSWGLRDGIGFGSANGVPRPEQVLELIQVPESEAPDESAKPLPVAALASALAPASAPVPQAAPTPAAMPQELPGVALSDLCELLAKEPVSEASASSIDSTAAVEPIRIPIRRGPDFSPDHEPPDGASEVLPQNSSIGSASDTEADGESLASPADYLSNPKPNYPHQARLRRQEGLVVLSVRVTADGVPVEVRVKRSSNFELLDESALRAVRHWRFTPARKGNRATASQIEVPIRFAMTD